MTAENERFLSRWSRLKHEQERQEKVEKSAEKQLPDKPLPQTKDDDAPPLLPSIDKLTPQSDFSPFMHPKVQDSLRRVALKKLFSDPHFNVPDVNEAYSGDWTGGEPITEEMLKQLEHARVTLFQEAKEEKAPEAPQLQEARRQESPGPEAQPNEPQQEPKNEPGRKDA